MMTRREFIGIVTAAGAAAAAIAVAPEICAAGPVRRRDVVSFHMDRPYVDHTGTAMPYLPPAGARSAAAVAHLSEEAFRRMQCYA
jgi:hypothetical protein